MKILLLPGLDGSGLLFKELLNSLPSTLDTQVICLDDLDGNSYAKKAQSLARRYSNHELTLVAESYSGPLAYELCNILESKIKQIVFLASFVSSPSALSKYAHLIPSVAFKPSKFNMWLLNKIGFVGEGSEKHILNVFKSIALSDKNKLKNRLQNISSLSIPSKQYTIPVIYIRPTRDLLVSVRAFEQIKKVFINTNVIVLSGGHFIAQKQPVKCADIIKETVCNFTCKKRTN